MKSPQQNGPPNRESAFWGKTGNITPELLAHLIQEAMEEDSSQGAGGTVIFLGHVKGKVGSNTVKELHYEAYEPHASHTLNKIAKQQAEDPQVTRTIIIHNTGTLKPGDPTIVIIVTAKTREAAFKVAREVLERVKKEPPIFKLEKRNDGEYWIVGDGHRIPRSHTKNQAKAKQQ